MTNLQIGDRVEVDWDRRIDRFDGGPYDRGTVEQITARMVLIKHPLGFRFTVSAADLASGTKITIKERAQVTDEMVCITIPEGKDWKDVLTKEQYLEWKKDGRTDTEITRAVGTYTKAFNDWKKEQGLIGVRLGAEGELIMPGAPEPLPPAQAANQLQAEIDAAQDGPVGLTVAEALERLDMLDDELDRCEALVEDNGDLMTERMTVLLAEFMAECKAEIERIKSARVVM